MFTIGLNNLKQKKSFVIISLVGIVVIHIYLLSRLIFFPYPELFIYSYLTEQGLIPYKEIFDQHFPGIMFFPINLATLGIDTPERARILHFFIVSVTHILLFIISKKLFKSNLKSLVSNLLYLVWQPYFEGYVLWIDTFMPLFLLSGFYFLLARTNRNLFYAGFFLGISLLFKQVTGPLIVIIALYLVYKYKSFKKVLPYSLGVLVPVLGLLLWVASLRIWREFFYWAVTFNLTTFSEMGRKYPSFRGLAKAFLLFGPAFLFLVIGIMRMFKDVILLALFLLGSLFFAYARFDYIHLQPSIPFAILLTLYVFFKFRSKRIFIFSIYIIISLPLIFSFYKANLSRETLFFGRMEKEISQKVMSYAKPGDSIFAFGTTPHLYQMTKTLPPGRVFVFQFPWFMVEAEDKIYQGLVKDPPKVVVRDKEATTAGKNLIEYMPEIESYVDRYYGVVDLVGDIEIMRPKK